MAGLSAVLDPVKALLPDWPDWALDVLLIMTGLLGVTYFVSGFFSIDAEELEREAIAAEEASKSANGNSKSNNNNNNGEQDHKKTRQELHKEFDAFRREYIIVYMVIMLADWMQGTHMYTLYLSYNVNISALFLTGFLSGAIFAPFLGSFVDKFGRKRSCIVYCVLEIIINTMEHSQNFIILLIGRILGGVSTNLLFSAFESWMTTEHRKKGFPDEWLSRTYSESSVVNGVMAVLAGIVAQVLEDFFGHIGPFQGAIALTVLALVLVLRWEENYGEDKAGEHSSSSLYHQFVEGWKVTISDSRIWRIGMTQALSEGAMYTFVFMWVPTLLALDPPGGLPTGCIFSAMMMAISAGGMMFPPLYMLISKYIVPKINATEVTASLVYLLASLSMVVPAMCLSLKDDNSFSHFEMIIASFMLIEFCVGAFMPLAGTLRSKYVPDALQGGILNIFRLPLNAIVVSGTYATDVLPPADVFKLVSASFYCAALLQATLVFRKDDTASKSIKKD